MMAELGAFATYLFAFTGVALVARVLTMFFRGDR